MRNMHNPRFVGDPYSAEDLNGAALGETIVSVSAVDDDENNPYNRDVSAIPEVHIHAGMHAHMNINTSTPTHKHTHTHTHTHTHAHTHTLSL